MTDPMHAYAVIRRTDGRERIEVGSVRLCRDECDDVVREYETLIPEWCRANPVQRIVRVTITEES